MVIEIYLLCKCMKIFVMNYWHDLIDENEIVILEKEFFRFRSKINWIEFDMDF